mgnify:CR=1 FL=1
MASMIDETFLTTEEVLEYLQVNLRTVYRLIKAGKIPAVRVGRQWRFRKSDIDAWLDSQQTRPARPTPPSAPEPVVPPINAVHPPRRRILVVDDEPGIRDLLSRTFALAEYDVDVAADGLVALDRMRQTQYDLLVADLKMPIMDGLSMIREAKRYKSDLPVIIITTREAVEPQTQAPMISVRFASCASIKRWANASRLTICPPD